MRVISISLGRQCGPRLKASTGSNIGTKLASHLSSFIFVIGTSRLIASHFDIMTELTAKTWRAHRNLLERLKGYEKMYETKLSDGEKTVRGRGRTREESIREAERNWLRQFEDR
jgi:hypothetical protein